MSKEVLKDTKGVLNFYPRGLEPLFRSGSTGKRTDETFKLETKFRGHLTLQFVPIALDEETMKIGRAHV